MGVQDTEQHGSTDKFIATFNRLSPDFMATPLFDSGFENLIQVGSDDLDFWYEPYLITPRLAELTGWMMAPSKNTNIWLSKVDPVVRILIKLMSSMTVGDGIKVKIYNDRELKEENEKYTSHLEDWLCCPAGSSGDNRGKTLNNWVIPRIIVDNITTGASAWYKFIGMRDFSPDEEVGELMMKWLDPRTYMKVHHPFTDKNKLVQYPVIQWNVPKTESEWEMWNPTVRNRFESHYNLPPTVEQPPVPIDSNDYYWFNLFGDAPLNAVIQKIVSKIMLQYFEDKYIEKATFPFFVVRVPRNAMIDTDDPQFQAKLRDISELFGDYRTMDVFAIEGEVWGQGPGGEKITYSEGWIIEPVSIKDGTLDFNKATSHLNEEIAYGLLSSMALISAIGVQGRTSTLTTGGQINANFTMIIKDLRKTIAEVFRFVFRDVLKEEFGIDIDLRLIEIHFSKIREEDAAQFLNQMISLFNSGALTTNELRDFADRLGMELKPLPPEMTPEGQALLGLDEIINAPDFEIPQSWLEITGPEVEMEKVHDDITNEDEKDAAD
jgi:hypothetical protein